MTFTFTMDCFPDYTKFDKTHKVFCALQIIGDENIHPDDPEEAGKDTCDPVNPEIKAVTAGVKDWTTTTDGAVKFSTLGNNLRASQDRANIDFFGNLNKVSWPEFDTDASKLTGYYFPFSLEVDGTLAFSCETRPVKTYDAEAGKANIILSVDPDKPVVEATLVDSGTSYTLDFSKVVFK